MNVISILFSFILLKTCFCYYVEYPTLMEDVAGEYTLHSLKEIIINNTITVTSAINSIFDKLSNFDKYSELNLMAEKMELSAKKSDLDEVRKSVYQIGNYTVSHSQSMESNLMKAIEQIPMATFNKTNEMLSLIVKASLLNIASDCADLYKVGFNTSGSYWLQKFGIHILCDMETDGGGWLVIQRRVKLNEQVSFDKNWASYKIGFGNIDTEFWIGNDILHILTNQKQYELLIEMIDFEKGPFYARYRSVRVGNENSSYSLDVGNYTGNATDAFSYHHGRPFTTTDSDDDSYTSGNCANYFSGGWWYDKCYDAHLNGIYPDTPNRSNASYITWWSRDDTNKRVPLVLSKVVMKIRPFTIT